MTQDYLEAFHPLWDQQLGGTLIRRSGRRLEGGCHPGTTEASKAGSEKPEELLHTHQIGAQQVVCRGWAEGSMGQELSWKHRKDEQWLESGLLFEPWTCPASLCHEVPSRFPPQTLPKC